MKSQMTKKLIKAAKNKRGVLIRAEDVQGVLDSITPNVSCTECKWKNTNRCPAYDTHMQRTSLRIRECNCGEVDKI